MLLQGEDAQKSVSPTPSSHRSEAGDTGDAVDDLRADVDSLNQRISQMGNPSKMPFRFIQSSWLPSKWSLKPECQHDHPIYEDQMCYYVHIRVTLVEGEATSPSFPCIQWFINCRYVSRGSWRVDYWSCNPCHREAILFFGRWSLKEGLPFGNARDVRFSFTDPIIWASRTAQVEVTINTVQEGCWAIVDVVVEKRTKAWGPGTPHRMTKVKKTPAMANNIEEWMQGMEEDAPEVEVINGNLINHRPEWRNACSQHVGWGSWQHRRQGRPWFPRDMSGGSPSSGDGSSNWESDQSSQQSTMMRVSGESNWPVWPGRGLRMKVNLPIFKDEKTKDAVTYCSWQWDVTIFCCLHQNNQHLLPYVLQSL